MSRIPRTKDDDVAAQTRYKYASNVSNVTVMKNPDANQVKGIAFLLLQWLQSHALQIHTALHNKERDLPRRPALRQEVSTVQTEVRHFWSGSMLDLS